MLRTTPVKIGGTSWIPNLPYEPNIKDDLNNIISSYKDDVEKGIDLLLYTVKKQMFIDGNKRTSAIFANHYLISKGKGLIVIPVDKIDEYKSLLIKYYETNDDVFIKSFLLKYCYVNI